MKPTHVMVHQVATEWRIHKLDGSENLEIGLDFAQGDEAWDDASVFGERVLKELQQFPLGLLSKLRNKQIILFRWE